MIDNNQVGYDSHSIPAPLLALVMTERGEETGQDHHQISNNGNKDVCTVQASKNGEVQQKERSGNAPIDVTRPEDLAVDINVRVWDVLVGLRDDGVCERVSTTCSHGIV